jgi:hypothetical protein
MNQKEKRQNSADESAVKNSAASQKVQRKNTRGICAKLFVNEKHQNLRAEQSADQSPEPEVVDSLARKSIARGEARRHEKRKQHPGREQDAVSVYGKITDAKYFRKHGLILDLRIWILDLMKT